MQLSSTPFALVYRIDFPYVYLNLLCGLSSPPSKFHKASRIWHESALYGSWPRCGSNCQDFCVAWVCVGCVCGVLGWGWVGEGLVGGGVE